MKKIIFSSLLSASLLFSASLEIGKANELQWNLVGMSSMENDIINLTNLSKITRIVGWDCSSGSCTTVEFNVADKEFYESKGKTYSPSLSKLNNGSGYWIKTNDLISLNLTDTTSPNITFNTGWNLVSGKTDASIDSYVQDLTSDGISISRIVGWDCSSGSCTTVEFNVADKEFYESKGKTYSPSLSNIKSSQGYWVKVSAITDPETGEVETGPNVENQDDSITPPTFPTSFTN
jgi:hypothetical protein